MSREDGFLSRWSRLKQEQARPVPPPPDAAAREAEALRVAEAARAASEREAAEARAREALLARLPKLEDLRVDSDFAQFMHPLVPQALRSAALARLWTLDPSIRAYEDPARDYAWNWNVPGGVPGGGPAPGREEIESTLRDLFKRFETEERVEAPPSLAQRRDDAAPAGEPAPGSDSEPVPVPVAAPDVVPDAVPADPSPAASAAPEIADAGRQAPEPAPVAAPAPLRRRHGGAMPG